MKNAKGSCLSLIYGVRYGNWRRKSTHSNVFVKYFSYFDPTPKRRNISEGLLSCLQLRYLVWKKIYLWILMEFKTLVSECILYYVINQPGWWLKYRCKHLVRWKLLPCETSAAQRLKFTNVLEKKCYFDLQNIPLKIKAIFFPTVGESINKIQTNRCNNNGLLIIPISSTCFGQLFCPSSGALECVLQLVIRV